MMMDTLVEPTVAKAIAQDMHDALASGKIESVCHGRATKASASPHAGSRSSVVPVPTEPTPAEQDKHATKSRYITWAEILCAKCKGPLRLIALSKSEDAARKILTAMHLPVEVPELHPARPQTGETATAMTG
jgi:hypothetical protein